MGPVGEQTRKQEARRAHIGDKVGDHFGVERPAAARLDITDEGDGQDRRDDGEYLLKQGNPPGFGFLEATGISYRPRRLTAPSPTLTLCPGSEFMKAIHGSCVAIGEIGVLIRGPSGAGKSDLALRLIDHGAVLVADDYCDVETRGGEIYLAAPRSIAGRMEVRGWGVARMAHRASAKLGLVVDLARPGAIERLPEKTAEEVAGVSIPWMRADPTAPSADAKIRFAVRALAKDNDRG